MTKCFSVCFVAGVLSSLTFAQEAGAQAHQHTSKDEKPWSMADNFFDPDEMAKSRAQVLHHHGGQSFGMMMVDRLEFQSGENSDVGAWEASYRYGDDINKLHLKAEGEYVFDHDEFEAVQVQALWSHAISRYFDLQTGLRYDAEPSGLVHGVIGFHGLAPYWFELDGAAYVSENGDVTADIEAEYELLISQRLILQPSVEVNLSAQAIPERGVGAGLTGIEAGLRLRYEVKREVAPYIGIEQQVLLGDTADLAKVQGEDTNRTLFVVGIRSWF